MSNWMSQNKNERENLCMVINLLMVCQKSIFLKRDTLTSWAEWVLELVEPMRYLKIHSTISNLFVIWINITQSVPYEITMGSEGSILLNLMYFIEKRNLSPTFPRNSLLSGEAREWWAVYSIYLIENFRRAGNRTQYLLHGR